MTRNRLPSKTLRDGLAASPLCVLMKNSFHDETNAIGGREIDMPVDSIITQVDECGHQPPHILHFR